MFPNKRTYRYVLEHWPRASCVYPFIAVIFLVYNDNFTLRVKSQRLYLLGLAKDLGVVCQHHDVIGPVNGWYSGNSIITNAKLQYALML